MPKPSVICGFRCNMIWALGVIECSVCFFRDPMCDIACSLCMRNHQQRMMMTVNTCTYIPLGTRLVIWLLCVKATDESHRSNRLVGNKQRTDGLEESFEMLFRKNTCVYAFLDVRSHLPGSRMSCQLSPPPAWGKMEQWYLGVGTCRPVNGRVCLVNQRR